VKTRRPSDHEKVFAVGPSFVDGIEHHAVAGFGVCVARDFYHHDDSAGE
jgi:hypothetical protein